MTRHKKSAAVGGSAGNNSGRLSVAVNSSVTQLPPTCQTRADLIQLYRDRQARCWRQAYYWQRVASEIQERIDALAVLP